MNGSLLCKTPVGIASTLLCLAWSTGSQAEIAMYSGPLSTVSGTGDRVECTVVNVDAKPVQNVSLKIRSTNFSVVVAEASCPVIQPGAECHLSFPVPGPAHVVRLACSVEAAGKKDALRGTFLRTNSYDDAADVAVELR